MAKPKQVPLIETEIRELEKLAEEYADYRDERMKLGAQEVELKDKLLGAMHKHGKKDYVHGDVEIHVVAEEEKVKVKIRKPKEETDED